MKLVKFPSTSITSTIQMNVHVSKFLKIYFVDVGIVIQIQSISLTFQSASIADRI